MFFSQLAYLTGEKPQVIHGCTFYFLFSSRGH